MSTWSSSSAWGWSSVRQLVQAGAVSTLVTGPTIEPLTVAQGKLRAGLDWDDGDPRDALMQSWIAAARAKVENDTGHALLTQTRDVTYDACPGATVDLPAQCRPVQSVTSVSVTSLAGVVTTVDPLLYGLDRARGRIGLLAGSWTTDVQTFQPWVVRLVAGWPSAADLPPGLLQAVGLMTGHYATAGRDVVQLGHVVAETPYGYEDAIAAYRTVALI